MPHPGPTPTLGTTLPTRTTDPSASAAGLSPPPREDTPRPARSRRGLHVGPSSVNRGHPGSTHHLIVDSHGIPLAVTLHSSGLGKVRWVVGRAFAWLYAFKRLRTRYERRADTHLGLLQLACALICHRRLETSS